MIEQAELHSKIYWDKIWNKFGRLNALIAPSSKLIQHLISNIQRNGTVLDLGCGEGRNSIYLSRIGFNVLALDLSLEASKSAKSNFFEEELRGKAITGDACRLPIKDESIDGILAHHIFDHLTKIGFEYSIEEVFRILKPGGILLMTMGAFATARTDPDSIITDDGTVIYVKGNNKGMIVRPYIEEEMTALSRMGWNILINELTPKRNKMLLLKKAYID